MTSFNRPNIFYSVVFKDRPPAAAPLAGGSGGGDDGEGGAGMADAESGFGQLLALLRDALPFLDAGRQQQQQQEQEQERAGRAIVYARKRTAVSGLARRLAAAGVPCGAYHAGLRAGERAGTLSRWRSGELAVCVATVAFGMGVDAPDGGWRAQDAGIAMG